MTQPGTTTITASALAGLDRIGHGFFTRNGGVSGGIYASLNCGYGSDDDNDNVTQNRALIAHATGAEPENLLTVKQIHSATCVIAENAWRSEEAPQADAVVTNNPNLRVAILTADCAPVLFADPENGVVGAAHAGWRGAKAGIISATVKKMEQLGSKRDTIYAAVGPAISSRSYEIGPEFFKNFIEDSPENACFFEHFQNGSVHFNLPEYVRVKLKQVNITHTEVIDLCTVEKESVFFSYRRSVHKKENDYGRQLSTIWLK